MWKQFKENKEKALDNYMNALSLVEPKHLPELYKAAGLVFDFSPDHIRNVDGVCTGMNMKNTVKIVIKIPIMWYRFILKPDIIFV